MICPECQGDEHHAPGCTQHPRHDRYWLGYRHGQRVAEYAGHLVDHEPALREELRLIGTSNGLHRAFALGELRGYRQASDRA